MNVVIGCRLNIWLHCLPMENVKLWNIIIFLTYGGSFEQVVGTGTDTTVFPFNKLLALLISGGPNTIEPLGRKPERYLVLTPGRTRPFRRCPA